MTDQKVAWIRTGITLGGFLLAAAGLQTGLQVSIAKIRKDREFDKVQIVDNLAWAINQSVGNE